MARTGREFDWLAHLLRVGFFRPDSQDGLKSVNQKLADLTGIRRNDLLKSKWFELFHEDDRARLRAAWKKALQVKGTRPIVDCRLRQSDGGSLPAVVEFGRIGSGPAADSCVGTVCLHAAATSWESLSTEPLLRGLLESFPHGIFEHDARGLITYSNAAFARVHGCLPGEMAGRRVWDLLADSSEAAVLRETLAELFVQQPPPFPYVTRHRTDDGRVITAQIAWFYRRNEEGVPVGLTSVFTDITGLAEAQEQARSLGQRYQELFDEAPLMYVTTRIRNGAPIIQDCNQLFASSLGYTRSELAGKPLADCYSPSSRLQLLNGGGYERALQGYFGYEERQLLRRDGSVLDTLLRAVPASDPGGQVIGTRAIYMDITERKRTEEALAYSEAQYRRLFEQASDAIIVSSRAGRVVDINSAGLELLGYESKEQIARQKIEDLIYQGSPGREALRRLRQEENPVQDWELHIRTKDGRDLTVLETSNAITDSNGNVVRYQSLLRDVTRRRQLEKQLLHSQKMEALGRLAGGIAHDFNNLLTAILGFTELLALPNAKLDGSSRLDLQEIRRAAEQAASLTRQLLLFARRQKSEAIVLDLNLAVRDVERLLRRTIGEDIELRTDLCPEAVRIMARRGQVEQILMNMAVNARDAMPKGGILTIQTESVKLSQDGVAQPKLFGLLSIRDNGLGMDEATQSRIFEPFFTTKERSQGTGLGLSTVYAIVKQSDGEIAVSSEPGAGTTFRLYFPSETKVEKRPRQVAEVEPGRGTGTVLVVEDDAGVRELTAKVLRHRGYKVLVARTALEAITISEEHQGQIDLLVTDIVMPKMSGVDLVERILSVRSETKVLSMTGYDPGESVVNPRVPLLQKPFTPHQLVRKIQEILGPE